MILGTLIGIAVGVILAVVHQQFESYVTGYLVIPGGVLILLFDASSVVARTLCIFLGNAIGYGLIGFLVGRERDRKAPGPHECQNCGYNLTGNISGRCPECGRVLTDAGVK